MSEDIIDSFISKMNVVNKEDIYSPYDENTAVGSYENARLNYLNGYAKGKKETAESIADYISFMYYSPSEEIVEFRMNQGTNGVIKSILDFIHTTYCD